MQIPRIYDSQTCSGNISKDADQLKFKSLETEYTAPEPKVEFAQMVLQDEVIEMGQADQNPVSFAVSNARNAGPRRKADLAGFDREKFYKRLGINIYDPKEE